MSRYEIRPVYTKMTRSRVIFLSIRATGAGESTLHISELTA